MSDLRFNIEKPGNVKLIILDMIGLKLDELKAGFRGKGEHIVTWKPKFNLSGSVLYMKVELNEKIIGENMFVVR
jgi:hypothetical protein